MKLRIPVIVVCLAALSTGANAGDTELRTAAQAFISSLDSAQQKSARFGLQQDTRATWSNLPLVLAPAAGILLKDLEDAQRELVHRMLRASLSSQGYGKAAAIMWLDDVLRDAEARSLVENPALRDDPIAVAMADDRDSGNYAVAIFGDPANKNWGWKVTGHHLAVNITVSGTRIGYVPVFVGSNPMMVTRGRYAGWMALPAEGQAGIDLVTTLSPDQRRAAVLALEVPPDIFEGPGRRATLKEFEGLSAKSLNSAQLALLQQLVGEYVRNANAASAAEHLDAIGAAGWDALWFSWRGPVDIQGKFYYRVHGPRILIEYNRQDENHDHAVLRDPANDYGEDWLGHHYNEFHPTLSEVMQDVRRRLGMEDEN